MTLDELTRKLLIDIKWLKCVMVKGRSLIKSIRSNPIMILVPKHNRGCVFELTSQVDLF